jgi:hypothetical protein
MFSTTVLSTWHNEWHQVVRYVPGNITRQDRAAHGIFGATSSLAHTNRRLRP